MLFAIFFSGIKMSFTGKEKDTKLEIEFWIVSISSIANRESVSDWTEE